MINIKFPNVSDKLYHFVAGIVIASLVLIVTKEPWFGFAGALMMGGYKEFSDHLKVKSISPTYSKHTYLDWISTMLGGLLVELIF